jgi:hypothetical protein
MSNGAIEIRSYRVVFDFERRIHRVDRWRLPCPYGLPLRSLAYAMASLGLVVAASRLRFVGDIIMLLPPPVRLVLAPVGIAYGLTRLQPDGRTAHAAARAWIAHCARPRRIAAWRAAPPVGSVERLSAVVLAPAAGAVRVGAGTVRGLATVVLDRRARIVRRGRTLIVRQDDGDVGSESTRISFGAAQRVVLR